MSLADRAYVLRMDHDLSIRTISQRLGVPKSTVGDWLRGHGEAKATITCRLCGDVVYMTRSHAVFCSRACSSKHSHTFGPVAA